LAIIIIKAGGVVWFEMIRRELGPSGWLFGEVDWDADNGIRIAPTAADWKALIAEKQKKYDVSNDIRKLLESDLKDIASLWKWVWRFDSMMKTNIE
jgi:hypothetical protein